MTTIDDSTRDHPHVSFLSTCELIPDEPQSSGLLFGLKSFSLHLSLPHRRRAPSQDSIEIKPTLTVKVPSFSPRHKQSHVTSPTAPGPPPTGILKRSSSVSSNHSIESKATSPTRQRGRATSGSSSPPPETVPLTECCDDCLPAVQLAQRLGDKYKVTWTPGALAKKKRDDAEEQRDILAGLKQPCLIKWAELQRQAEENNPDGDQDACTVDDGEDDDECGSKPSSACVSLQELAEAHQPDALSQLDGTKNKSNIRSSFSSNKDWSPTKYYNSQDDEDDLFPLPSPKLTPPGTSPTSSQTNLATPVSPSDRSLPSGSLAPPTSYHAGLSPIVSANTSRAPSRASTSSVSSSTQSHSRRHSPLVPLTSNHLHLPHDDSLHSRQPSDPSVTARSKSSRNSTSSTNSSAMVWQFVPPPLPTKNGAHHPRPSRSGLTPAENTTSALREAKRAAAQKDPSPLTLVSSRNTITPASAKGSTQGSSKPLPQPAAGVGINGLLTSERANPPHMPTYSGKQREIVVIASSSPSKKTPAPSASTSSKVSSPTPTTPKGGAGKSLPPLPPSSQGQVTPSLQRHHSSSTSSHTTPTHTPNQITPPPTIINDYSVTRKSSGNLGRERGTVNMQRTRTVDEHGSLHKEVYNAGVSAGLVHKGANNLDTWNTGSSRNRSSSIKKMLSGIAAGMGGGMR
ncbi:hypothetical protein FRC03_003200 [Tulasnella sp. 419]|nr:hypothetical protein FRC03_003200 [Tulasnella sp. 419]